MANIALNKPSGGQLILSPEDGTSTETVTIPSVGVGKVLQVVSYDDTTYRNLNSTSFVGTGIKVSITPKEATSKLYVAISLAGFGAHNVAGNTVYTELRKDGVLEKAMDGHFGYNGNSSTLVFVNNQSNSFVLDSGSTATREYEVYWKVYSGGIATLNNYRSGTPSCSSITVMEVAA